MASKTLYQGVETLEVLEGANNYNFWIAQIIEKYIQEPVLEIGAGIGNISQCFLHHKQLVLSDIDEELVKCLVKRFEKRSHIRVVRLDISKEQKKSRSSFRSVFAVNVLEHIRDDARAFANIAKLLLPGGRLILLVPAKKVAFTSLDTLLGHYRRYEKDELSQKLQRNGFFIEKMYFFNLVELLSWVVRDKILRKSIHLSKNHIWLFDMLVPFLRSIEDVVKPPVGISLIVVARKTTKK